jgi:hypothetical protein
MQIVNQATEDLGISTHVCEMQLIHQPFAELKVMQVLTPHLPVISLAPSLCSVSPVDVNFSSCINLDSLTVAE